MSLLAHQYRHRVEIQEKVEEQDSEGAVTYTWQTLYLDTDTPLSSVPANVMTGAGREALVADAKTAETSARINLRWFSGLLPTHRIVWDGKNYDILSIETDLSARRQYRLRCREGMTDGS